MSRPVALSTPAQFLVLSAEDISTKPIEAFSPPLTGEKTRGDVTWRTVFSSPSTTTDSLCAGIAACPPGTGHLCPHRHTQAEMYYITEGSGIMIIDGIESKVETGSVVFIPGNAEHGIVNDSKEGKELKWLYVFPTGAFGDVVYRFS